MSEKLNDMANEVIGFLSKQVKLKTIQCQCGKPRQVIGFICDECGEIVQDE